MKKTICSLITISMIGSMAYAEDTAYTLGLNVGTNGAGIDISVPMTESLNIRASLNGATYSQSETESDIAYDVSGDLLTVGAILDYYPVQSSQFHLSAGAFYNGNQIEGNGKPTSGTYEINDIEYDADEIGSLDAALDFNGIAPYVGLGWGYNSSTSGWGFSFDVGALYHGTPQVAMDVTRGSGIPSDPMGDALFEEIQADVEEQRKTTEDDLSDFKWYPVVRIGLTYKF